MFLVDVENLNLMSLHRDYCVLLPKKKQLKNTNNKTKRGLGNLCNLRLLFKHEDFL
jgi:hypothetical protein